MAHVQKKIKFFYYLKSYARIFFPKLRTKAHFDALKSQLKPAELEKIQARVAYYNKVVDAFSWTVTCTPGPVYSALVPVPNEVEQDASLKILIETELLSKVPFSVGVIELLIGEIGEMLVNVGAAGPVLEWM